MFFLTRSWKDMTSNCVFKTAIKNIEDLHNRMTGNGCVRYDTAVDVLCPLKRGSQTVCWPPWPRCLASIQPRESVYVFGGGGWRGGEDLY